MLSLAKLKLLTNGNMSTYPGLEFAPPPPPPPPPPIAAFLFLPDVKIAMSLLVLFIISMCIHARTFTNLWLINIAYTRITQKSPLPRKSCQMFRLYLTVFNNFKYTCGVYMWSDMVPGKMLKYNLLS
jgi:hypothetical protein